MATIKEIINEFGLAVHSGSADNEKNVSAGYAGDLLSDVIANAEKDCIWVTMQIHENIVAVAVMKELAAIILVNGRKPEDATLQKARRENVMILSTDMSAFEIVGKLYMFGIRGGASK